MTAAPDVARIAGPRVDPPAGPRRPTSPSLPPELLADAARRLGWVAMIYAGAGVLGHFGRRLLLAAVGDFYYVMELLDGISLERYVELFGPMEPPRLIYLLRQVLHSLGEAHGRGLVHRDVKPANILLCRLGPDDDFVKVLDFGLAKHFDVPGATLLAKEGDTAGTPAYMAPEIALGHANIDGRADLYALGCVADYLLTAEPLFVRDSALAVALAHVQDAPVSPSLRSEFNIPAALDALILECLAKNPEARPVSAQDVDRRLATIDTPDAWTGEKAHAWLALHRLNVDQARTATRPVRSSIDADGERQSRRCWPCLDRRAAPRAPTAAY